MSAPMRDPASAFAATYAEARVKFLAAARARGAAVESLVHPAARGADGEELAIDVARCGETDAPALLVLTSAMHGAEGFCGSGCQVAWLDDDGCANAAGEAGVAVLLVHAVNPRGFSVLSRTNEDNVDLNRNFRDYTRPIPRNEAYAAVHELLVPPAWPPSRENEAKLAAYAREHGERGLQTAITSGQCDRPDGLFYGGRAPAWSNTTLRSILRRHGAHARRIAWLDYHTGLGPCGHGEKIYMGDDEPVAIARTRSFYGADVTSYYDGSSTSAPLSGVCYRAALDECPHAELTAIALEYGTVDLTTVVGALRGDQWLRNHADADAATRAAIKRAVRDAFYVDRADWKAMVWGQARAAIGSAIRGLCP